MYALKYAHQNDRNDTMKFLDRAYDQCNDELQVVEKTMHSMEAQLKIMEATVKAAAEHDRQEQVFALQRLEEECQKNQDFVSVDTHMDYQMREIKNMVIDGKPEDAMLRLRKLAEKYIYLPEESTADKKRKQDLKDPRHPIEITAEPVVPIREPNTS